MALRSMIGGQAWLLCGLLCLAVLINVVDKATVSAMIAGEPTNFVFDRNRNNQCQCNCSDSSNEDDEDNADDESLDPYAGCIASFAESENTTTTNSSCPFVFKTPQSAFRTDFGEFKVVTLGEDQLLQRRQVAIGMLSLEPKGLLLPQSLNGPAVFYVHTGKANFGYVEEKRKSRVLILGEVFAIAAGVPFYISNSQSNEKLLIFLLVELSDLPSQHATLECFYVAGGVYPATVMNGFPEETMAAAFQVSTEDLWSLLSTQEQGPIVNATKMELSLLASVTEEPRVDETDCIFKEHHHRLLDEKYIFRNQNGWTASMSKKRYKELEEANVGMFAVGLNSGCMVAPYWNSRMTEIGIVTHGRGFIQVAKSNGSILVDVGVEEGSVFVVPRFYPSTKLTTNDSDFEVVGFTTSSDPMQPYYLAGTNAVFKSINTEILSVAFNQSKNFIQEVFTSQPDKILLAA